MIAWVELRILRFDQEPVVFANILKYVIHVIGPSCYIQIEFGGVLRTSAYQPRTKNKGGYMERAFEEMLGTTNFCRTTSNLYRLLHMKEHCRYCNLHLFLKLVVSSALVNRSSSQYVRVVLVY